MKEPQKQQEKGKLETIRDLIERKTGVISKPSEALVSVPMREWPMVLWEEWNADCKAKGLDAKRWLKAYTDHVKARAYDTIVQSAKNIAVQTVQQPAEQATTAEEPFTFGDGARS